MRWQAFPKYHAAWHCAHSARAPAAWQARSKQQWLSPLAGLLLSSDLSAGLDSTNLDLELDLGLAPATSSGCGRWYSVGSYPSVATTAGEAKEEDEEEEEEHAIFFF